MLFFSDLPRCRFVRQSQCERPPKNEREDAPPPAALVVSYQTFHPQKQSCHLQEMGKGETLEVLALGRSSRALAQWRQREICYRRLADRILARRAHQTAHSVAAHAQ